jgi:hypothetical protein
MKENKVNKAIALNMKAASASETSVNFYHTTRRNIPEDSHFGKCQLARPRIA